MISKIMLLFFGRDLRLNKNNLGSIPTSCFPKRRLSTPYEIMDHIHFQDDPPNLLSCYFLLRFKISQKQIIYICIYVIAFLLFGRFVSCSLMVSTCNESIEQIIFHFWEPMQEIIWRRFDPNFLQIFLHFWDPIQVDNFEAVWSWNFPALTFSQCIIDAAKVR